MGRLNDVFPRLFFVSNQKRSSVGECRFWDGMTWIWSFQWRRNLFKWGLDLLNNLCRVLATVQLIGSSEDWILWKFEKTWVVSIKSWVQVIENEGRENQAVTSYNFTSAVWKGLTPPRIELLTWFVLVGRVNTKDRMVQDESSTTRSDIMSPLQQAWWKLKPLLFSMRIPKEDMLFLVEAVEH